MNVEKNGVIYFIKKSKGEVNNVYFDRINSIANSNPKNNEDLINNKKKYEIQCNEVNRSRWLDKNISNESVTINNCACIISSVTDY